MNLSTGEIRGVAVERLPSVVVIVVVLHNFPARFCIVVAILPSKRNNDRSSAPFYCCSCVYMLFYKISLFCDCFREIKTFTILMNEIISHFVVL